MSGRERHAPQEDRAMGARLMQDDVFNVKPVVSLAGITREEGPSIGKGKMQRFRLPGGRVFVAVPAGSGRWNVTDSTFNVPTERGFVKIAKRRGKPEYTVTVVEWGTPADFHPDLANVVANASHVLRYMYPMEIVAAELRWHDATFADRMDALACGVACLAKGKADCGFYPLVRSDLYPDGGDA